MRTIYLYYKVHDLPVTLGFDQEGNLVCLHRNGIDYTHNGQVAYEIIQALEERGVNLREAISVEFARRPAVTERKSAAVS